MSDRRTAQLERIARELKMEFREEDRWGLHTLLRDFHLFRQGRFRRISNLFYQTDALLDTQIYLFDYYFRKGKGHSGDHRQTVLFVHSKVLALPWFSMKPETFLHRIGELLGYDDIDFGHFPEFSRQYRLTGEDEAYIRASLHERVLRFFSEEKNWYLEGVNYYMIFYRQGKLLPPEKIRAFYRKGMEVFRLLAADQPG